ncbi:MAG: calcium/sodium antiporter [Patescibacteria group bacterium]|nr:MAG: calcium/sodium antiporter [Patescibacteria group bacterium]
MIIFWIIVFIISLAVLVKGADWLLESAEKIGLHLGLSPFVVGVLIVGIGTSLPELAASISAVFKGVEEIVVANAAGSNISNILLVIGVSAIVGRRLTTVKNLIDVELPLLAISTVLFLGVVYDGLVERWEAVLLVGSYVIYFLYTILSKEEKEESFLVKKGREIEEELKEYKHMFGFRFIRPLVAFRDYFLLILGAALLFVGAKYLIDSMIALSGELNIATTAISLSAVALGTSLPELVVSIRAVLKKKYEMSVGNILGSNAFNALMVVGIPGIATTLLLDEVTLTVGVPIMALATLLFVISGISKTIHSWEGMMYLMFYVFFMVKIFA